MSLCLYAQRSLQARAGECVVRELLATVPPLWRSATCQCAPCRRRRVPGLRARLRGWIERRAMRGAKGSTAEVRRKRAGKNKKEGPHRSGD